MFNVYNTCRTGILFSLQNTFSLQLKTISPPELGDNQISLESAHELQYIL